MKNQTIPCPVCQTSIPFDLQQLISGVKFNCPSCDAAIGLAEESKPMIEEISQKLDSIKDHISHN